MMIDDEDSEINKKKPYDLVDLENFSIDELNEYIIFLNDEKKRVKQEIENKRSAAGLAESVFK